MTITLTVTKDNCGRTLTFTTIPNSYKYCKHTACQELMTLLYDCAEPTLVVISVTEHKVYINGVKCQHSLHTFTDAYQDIDTHHWGNTVYGGIALDKIHDFLCGELPSGVYNYKYENDNDDN